MDLQKRHTDVLENNKIVIIDFWAPWCRPCVSFVPIFEAAAEVNPSVTFVKISRSQEQ